MRCGAGLAAGTKVIHRASLPANNARGARTMQGTLSVSVTALAIATGLTASLPAAAQSYPTKQIELIVPFVAGGTTDNIARLIAQRFTESWGQTVIVNSRPGGGSVIGTAAVAKAPPDGHTLLVTTVAFTVVPALQKLPYDPIRTLRRSRNSPRS